MHYRRYFRRVVLFAPLLIAALFIIVIGSTPANAQSCCESSTGDIDCDGGSLPDLGDLATMLDHLFLSFTPLCCEAEANTDGSLDGKIDIGDLQALLRYLFITFDETAACDQERIITDSIRLEVLGNIKPVFDSLLVHSDNFLSDLNAFLATQPKFEATGVDTASQSVWARFLDGSIYVAVDNFAPATDSGTSRLIAQASTPSRVFTTSSGGELPNHSGPAGLPWSTQVRSLVAVDSQYQPPNAQIEQLLTSHGYHLTADDASLEGLRHVGGDGVLFFTTHAAPARLRYGYSTFVLGTTTPFDSATLKMYSEFVFNGYLAVMQIADRASASSHTCLAVSPSWIIAYWTDFAPNAMVFINAPGSVSAQATTFTGELIGKKASAVFGWSGPIAADGANYVANFLVDRLLGANTVAPVEDPAQRAFDYLRVYQDLATRGLNRPMTSGSAPMQTEFKYLTGPGDFGLLTPSIRRLDVDEHGVMSISGLCGENPGSAGRVKVGDLTLPILSWESNAIRVQLPDSGDGSQGRVAFEIAPRSGEQTDTWRRSNEVNLTGWTGRMTYTHDDLGTLAYSIGVDLNLRADLHPYREEPHTVPIQPIVSCLGAPVSHSHAYASGHYTFNQFPDPQSSTDFTWIGQCLALSATAPIVNGTFAAGSFDPTNYQLALSLAAATDSCLTESRLFSWGDSSLAFFTTAVNPALYDDNLYPAFNLPLEPNWDIRVGFRQATIPSLVDSSATATVKLEWNTISAAYPPDPYAPR